MKKLAEVDAKLIDLIQAAYLWLYDRTGVYIATIATALILAGAALIRLDWISLGMTGFLILLFSPLYLLQAFNQQSSINATARVERHSKVRYGFLLAMLILIPDYRPGYMAWGLLTTIASGYMRCIQIRDREPKDFLARRQPAMAGMGG
jgi:hypothetical protein